jgi:hypothetical protein
MLKVLTFILFCMLLIVQNLYADKNQGNSAVIDQGKYLVEQFGCHTCHSPKIETDKGFLPDPDRLLSGHPEGEKLPDVPKSLVSEGKWAGVYSRSLTAWAGPWGVSYAANITPDKETGIGNWTKENFVSTIKLGIHIKALVREISPPMPWEQFSMLGEEDLEAIYFYLRSLKPVSNKVPEHKELKAE